MDDLKSVLGGGKAPTPFHDFMSGVELNYITDDAGVKKLTKYYKKLLEKNHSWDNPLLISVDVETTADESLIKTYEDKQKEFVDVSEKFHSFPILSKCTEDQKTARKETQQEMAICRSDLNAQAKHVKRAGLNVYTGQVRLLQIYNGEEVHVIDRWHVSVPVFRELGDVVLSTDKCIWLAHNAQFDVKMLTQHGITPARHPHCTLLQAQALISLTQIRKGLAYRCADVLGKEPSKTQQASDWSKDPLDDEQIRYAAGDVVATWQLHFEQMKLIQQSKRIPSEQCEWIYDLLRSSIRAVNEVMVNGIGFDKQSHTELANNLKTRDLEGRHKALEMFKQYSSEGAPVVDNPASTIQVANWLRFHLNKYPPYTTDNWVKTDTGQLKCGKIDLLENISQLPTEYHPPLLAVAEWADAKKNNSTLGTDFNRFINPMSERIHANFRIGGTETGRFSVTEPALQTINATEEFRHLFKSKDRHSLVVCDYGQIEVRVPAALSNDKVLLGAIEDGLDIHTLTARHCFKGDYPADCSDDHFKMGSGKWMRQAAKACIFGLLFGQGPRGLSQVLTTNGHPTTLHEASRIQHEVLDLYVGLKEWITQTRKLSDNTGYLWTPQGRVYSPLRSNQLFTKSINTPCQGGAAEIMLLCLSRFPKVWGNIPAKLVHVVHDELIAEVPDEFATQAKDIMIQTMMWSATKLFENIPQTGLVEGDIGKTWGEAK